MGAQVLVEGNHLNNVVLAVVTDLDSDLPGYAVERNNIFAGTSTTRITQTGSLSPPYSYRYGPRNTLFCLTSAGLLTFSCLCDSVDSSANVKAAVTAGAGVGVVTF